MIFHDRHTAGDIDAGGEVAGGAAMDGGGGGGDDGGGGDGDGTSLFAYARILAKREADKRLKELEEKERQDEAELTLAERQKAIRERSEELVDLEEKARRGMELKKKRWEQEEQAKKKAEEAAGTSPKATDKGMMDKFRRASMRVKTMNLFSAARKARAEASRTGPGRGAGGMGTCEDTAELPRRWPFYSNETIAKMKAEEETLKKLRARQAEKEKARRALRKRLLTGETDAQKLMKEKLERDRKRKAKGLKRKTSVVQLHREARKQAKRAWELTLAAADDGELTWSLGSLLWAARYTERDIKFVRRGVPPELAFSPDVWKVWRGSILAAQGNDRRRDPNAASPAKYLELTPNPGRPVYIPKEYREGLWG